MLKRILFSAFLLFAAIAAAEDFINLIGNNYEIFSADRPRFITPSNAKYFRWTSDEKKSARYPAYPKSKNTLTFYSHPVSEIIIFFRDNSVSSVYISIYNRGDNHPIRAEEFQNMMKRLYEDLKRRFPGVKPVYRREKLSDDMFVNAMIWCGGKYACTMKWSLSGKKKSEVPEYLQVEIEPFSPENDPSKRSLVRADRTGIESRQNLTENVRREKNGNVYIDNIPMVDQGQKGYCVAAVMERVLRYYNVPVNQHTVAQLCGTSATGGTDVRSMVKAMDSASMKFGVKLRDCYELFDERNAYNKIKNIVSEYNKLAKKAKKPEAKVVLRDRMLYLDETIMSLDPELYVKVRAQDSDYRNFTRTVTRNVLDGVPVVWCVMLGIVPEDKLSPQSRGGHMRLIIGFNNKNREILYTDSWGIGHELKSMPIENAWAITTKTLYLLPRERKR